MLGYGESNDEYVRESDMGSAGEVEDIKRVKIRRREAMRLSTIFSPFVAAKEGLTSQTRCYYCQLHVSSAIDNQSAELGRI